MKKWMEESVIRGVEMMAIAAKTAPKSKGDDFVGIKIITGDEITVLADAMVKYGEDNQKRNYDRDGENVRNSSAVLLLSLEDPKVTGLNCGACGVNRCADLKTVEGEEFAGPLCAWRLLDLGVALGSAVKTASILNLDNRIMYRVGAVARKIGMMQGPIVVGIPVSAQGKSIYFDRK
ncbi:MAG: ferredoxin domain-containing protein [Peptococcia bacterium]